MCIAIPGRVTSIGESTIAEVPGEVAFGDRTATVNLVMLPDVAIGDYVIVHSGYAIRVVSAETDEVVTALLCPGIAPSTAEPTAE